MLFPRRDTLGSRQGETLGVRSIDLLHVDIASSLKATDFLAFIEDRLLW
jgi:hypothetical protein